MLYLLRYLKPYRKETTLAPLFKMMEAVLDLLVPLLVARIIDYGILKRDTAYIVKMGGLFVLFAIAGLLLAIIAQYFAAKAAAGFGTRIRRDLFKKIESMSYIQLDRLGVSTLITRMTTDVNQVQSQVNMAIRLLLRSPFIVFGAIVMAFFVDGQIAVVFVIATLLLSVIVFVIMIKTIPMYKNVQTGLDHITRSVRENLKGVRVLRAFNRRETELDLYSNQNQELCRLQMAAGKISMIMNPATYVVVNVAIMGILWFGGKKVYQGRLTQGQIVALLTYMSQILVELIKLSSLLIQLNRAFACATRIEDILKWDIRMDSKIRKPVMESQIFNQTQDCKKGVNSGDVAISFEHVSFSYGNVGKEAVNNININIKKALTVGIIGGTGSGKTTLINMIPRFYEATKGVVKVNGIDVRDYPLNVLRNKIGIVPQKPVLFPGTVKSNLLWGNEQATEDELLRALKLSQCYDFVMKKDKGLLETVSENGDNFSGGQKQRLTIARALIRQPEILILDDSFSALDYATGAALKKSLQELDGVTKIIVSQRVTAISESDMIIVVDEGKLEGIGTHKELLSDCVVYREICETQLRSVNHTLGVADTCGRKA